MRRTAIAIIIACAVGTLTTVSAAGQQYPSGEDFANKVESLRLAIEDLIQTFGEQYPGGRAYLERLQSINEEGLPKLQREALLANPLVSGQPLLYVVRAPDTDGTHHYLEPETFQEHGSALKVIDLANGRTETIVETSEGIIRNPCVHFDGRRILFAMSRSKNENFNIFEVDVATVTDRNAVKQLTYASDVSDVDPIYMVDDSIVFASSRDLKYVPCDLQIVPQLFRMAPDGANVHQITRSTAHENQVSLMPDGRVLYSRWDYVDRNFGDGHGFWVVHPDGTNQALIWGNNTTHPSAAWTARFIPGTGRLLCILGVHHGSLGGALAILDPRAAIEGYESIVRTWPFEVKGRFQQEREESLENAESSIGVALQIWSPVMRHLWSTDPNMRLYRHTDALRRVRPWYNTPWPLSEKYFLCVRAAERKAAPAIYLIDVFGNELMVHKEGAGCFSPMPLAPSSRPVSIPSRRDYGNGDGLFYIQDVYQGTHMQGIEPGTVKAVRVVEAISKRGLSNWAEWAGLGGQSPCVNWMDFNAKQVMGTAPVEEDGSAYFAVPSDRFVYFQLLDENGMMVQSMRSGTSVHSGEMLACVGCHESRHAASPSSGRAPVTLASMRAPSKLRQWYGPSRPFNYATEIQPVLDKHCVECHDFGKDGAEKTVLSGDKTASFNVSYMELWRKGFVGGIGAGPAGTLPPKSWGSHTSKLVKFLNEGHKDVKLDDESMDRLITWIDLNGPYYPTNQCAYPNNPPGRSPLEKEETDMLGKLSGFTFREMISAHRSKGPMISFDRPELSPCLSSLSENSQEYREALALIRKGKERLKKRPRADMPGFIPWERDLRRMAHQEKYRKIEVNSRKAIREGTLRYEPDQEVYKEIEVSDRSSVSWLNP